VSVITLTMLAASMILGYKLKSLGTKPITPSAPQSKPLAQADPLAGITPVLSCKLNFIVSTASPTPPSSTPTVTPSGTVTPLPTGTVVPGGSYCDLLTANPNSGALPLTVRFTGKGYDTTKIKGYRFTFGDGEKMEYMGNFNSLHIQEAQYIYTKVGTFTARLEILDAGDHYRTREECRKIITVTKSGLPSPTISPPQLTGTVAPKPTKPPPTPTEIQLPVAGIKIPTLGGILAGIFLVAIGLAIVF